MASAKPNFFRFKRKFNSGEPTAVSPKHRKKNTVSKGQTTLSAFFLASKCSTKKPIVETCNDDAPSDKIAVTSEIALAGPSLNVPNVNKTVPEKRAPAKLGKKTLLKLQKFTQGCYTSVSQDKDDDGVLLSSIQTAVSNRPVKSELNALNVKHSPEPGIQEKNDSPVKYTPFEKQIVELKNKYPGMVLLVEAGYKFRFFGDDAKIASEVLNIMASIDHNFLTASIPFHRLYVHVRRLVEHGHKVGVVKQTETTALKANSATKSSIFSRELTAVYTKSTLIGEDVEPISTSQEDELNESSVCSMACIAEIPRPQNKHHFDIGIVVLEPATGEAVFDSFIDLPNRAELEKRLRHTRPVEIIVPKSLLSHDTEQLLATRIGQIERVPDSWFEYSEALSQISDFLSEEAKTKLGELNPCVSVALGAMLKHLREFGLSKALSPNGLKPFTTSNTILQMDAGSVKNLELFETELDKNKGSLCWVLDHTKTSFGARLLRRWVSQPLRTLEPLLERQDAVSELLRPEVANVVTKVTAMLMKLPDLEKDLTCVLHGKITTAGFASLVTCLSDLYLNLKAMEIDIWSVFTNDFIENLFVETVENLQGIVSYQENLNFDAAKEGDRTKLLKDWSSFPEVIDQLNAIAEIIKELNSLKPQISKKLGMFTINYSTVSGMEFLIELKNQFCPKIPTDWVKVSSTKQVSRWRPPDVASLYVKLCQHRERLSAACSAAWLSILNDFSRDYHIHKTAIANLAKIDVLIAFAHVSKQDGFCRPVLQEGEPLIEIKNGRHPILSHLFSSSQEVVANNTALGGSHERCMIITGPNMGGKSSYIRQVALLVVMAQIGCYIPAYSATISLVDAIFTRMGSRDEIYHGRSTLLVELEETSQVLSHASPHSLAILDELGRGTSSCDGAAIAVATLKYIVSKVQCMTLFVTHYPVVMTLEQQLPDLVKNYHMGFKLHSAADDNDGEQILTFLYHIEQGGAHHSYGLNVARLANLPATILTRAAEKAQHLQHQVVTSSQRCKNFQRLWQCSNASSLRNSL